MKMVTFSRLSNIFVLLSFLYSFMSILNLSLNTGYLLETFRHLRATKNNVVQNISVQGDMNWCQPRTLVSK